MQQRQIIRIAIGGAAVIAVVLIFTWLLGGFTTLSGAGALALILGVTVTIGLGIALMALVFYSSRSERDEAVYHVGRHEDPR
jgi:Zn-dependent protease with chaperone function